MGWRACDFGTIFTTVNGYRVGFQNFDVTAGVVIVTWMACLVIGMIEARE